MFQRLLLPLDGSVRAAQAIPVAARIARATGGSLILLTTIPSVENWVWQETPLFAPEMLEAEQERTRAELSRLASSSLLEGIEIVQEVVQGSPAATILAMAQTRRADLMVLCSHGRTGLKRWALGSVAQKVVRSSPIPVLILSEKADGLLSEQAHARPIRVMIALDGSPLAESALQPAVELSTSLSAPFPGALHLVHVLPFSNAFEYGQEDAVAQARRERTREAQAYLGQMQKQLLRENPDTYVMTSLATSRDIAETLINVAETGMGEGMSEATSTSDVIALATHGRGGLARWLIGSVAERILSATRLPLLVVRPPLLSQTGEPHTQQESGRA